MITLNRLFSTLGSVALLALVPSAAMAQEPATPLPAPTAPTAAPTAAATGPAPGFVTIDRGDQNSFVDVSFATSFFEGDDPDFNNRLELYGQYVTPSGLGGYVNLPFSYLSDSDESETAMGNLELGALHNLLINPNTNLVLRGGLTLPTADEDFPGIITNLANANARFTDLITVFPETTALRLAASPVYRSGNLFVRADGGFDITLDSAGDGDEPDPVVRINLAAGVLAGTTAVMAELATLGTTGDVNDGDDRFYSTMAISARFKLATLEGFGALVLPLDDGIGLNVDMTLVAGFRIPLSM